ncbi:MAG: hypothetical protein HY720_30755 [Planctomycetes bacterium]|nr:hypothetical protein [Planctomycetota bacterium]
MKAFVIAGSTYREVVRHPAYYIVLGVALVLIWLSYSISFFQLSGEITSEVLQMGVASMSVCSLFLAVLGASRTIYEEVENRAALTVLSKPVSRASYVLGKFLGVYRAVLFAVVLLTLSLLTRVWLEMDVGARLAEEGESHWSVLAVFYEASELPVKGALLALGEAAILTAMAVLLSTWLPFEGSAIVLLGFFLAGHFSGAIRALCEERGWTWIARILYYLIPTLEDFSIDRAIATGSPVSHGYIVWTWAYGLTVTAGILFLALVLFRERELA